MTTAAASGADGRIFAARLRDFGSAPALILEDGRTLSYADLADAVDAFAARLGPDRRLVLIEAANALEPLIAYLAALAGGHAVILSADAGERLHSLFRPDAVFRETLGRWTLDLSPPEGRLHPDLALLLSTSGTTGATKLVRLPAAAVEANARSIAAYLGLGPGERALTTLPIHYSYGLSVINSHLASGGTLLLTGRSLLDPATLDFLSAHKGTSLAGVPYSYELLDRISFWDKAPDSLRTLTQAGGRLPADTAARIGAWGQARGVRLFLMYGQTEATARMAWLPPDRLADAPDCIGIPIPGGRFELRDEAGAPIAQPDCEGELVYHGPNVMMGYAENRSDLARGADIDALATGDLAVRRADGLYRITGRASRIAKPFGLRLSLDELERQLAADGVKAAVTGTDELIAIAIETSDPAAAAAIAQRLAARTKLPESLFEVVSLPEIPHLPSGKTDYRRILADADAQRADRAAPTRSESAVMAAFRETLRGRTITPDSSFVSLGGDSLSYIQVALALESVIGPLPDGWERLPITELEARARPADGARTWPRIDSEMLLRALALIAVIVNHASSYPVGGGSDALMLLAGFALARFQSDRLIAGRGFDVVRDFFFRVMLPYLGLLLLYSLVRKPVGIEHFLLIGNYFPSPGGFLTPFWFLDALFQVYLLVALLFLLPPVRAAAARDPFRLGLWFAAGAFLVKFGAVLAVPDIALRANRTADAALVLFALGWLVWFARSRRQKAITAGLALILAGLTVGLSPPLAIWAHFPPVVGEMRALWLLLTAGLLLALPRLPVPALLRRAVVAVSAAGYHIYLSHGLVIYAVVSYAPATPVLVTVLVAILLGLALNRGLARLPMPGQHRG